MKNRCPGSMQPAVNVIEHRSEMRLLPWATGDCPVCGRGLMAVGEDHHVYPHRPDLESPLSVRYLRSISGGR